MIDWPTPMLSDSIAEIEYPTPIAQLGVPERMPFAYWEKLFVTDLSFPGGDDGPKRRAQLKELGCTVVPNPVNVFDYRYDLKRNDYNIGDEGADLVIMFGMCYNTFNSTGKKLISTDPRRAPFSSTFRIYVSQTV